MSDWFPAISESDYDALNSKMLGGGFYYVKHDFLSIIGPTRLLVSVVIMFYSEWQSRLLCPRGHLWR